MNIAIDKKGQHVRGLLEAALALFAILEQGYVHGGHAEAVHMSPSPSFKWCPLNHMENNSNVVTRFEIMMASLILLLCTYTVPSFMEKFLTESNPKAF